MGKHFFFNVIVVLVTLQGCQKNSKDNTSIRSEHADGKLVLDSILFSLPQQYSGNGIIQLMGDSIYFIDRSYATITAFSLDGKIGETNLGKGEGPNEVTDVLYVWRHSDYNYVYFPPRVWKFSLEWKIIRSYVTDFGVPRNQVESLLFSKTTNEETLAVYKLQFEPYTMMPLAYLDDDNLILPVAFGTPNSNAYEKEEYYQKAHTMGLFNSEFNAIKIFGTKPLKYLDYHFIPNHDYTYFDYSDQKLFVGHEPDSLIYVYDKDFKLLYTFGRSGVGMNMNYLETSTIDEGLASENYYLARAREGYYEYIKHFDDLGILLRTYKTGSGDLSAKYTIENPTRIQFYKNTELIHDLFAEKRFRILGYREPYFYADGIVDEENERLGIYRFRLKLE